MSTPLGPCPQAQPGCPLLPLPVPRCSLLTTPSPAAPSAGGDASSQPWTLSSSLHASNHHGIYSWRLDTPPPLTGVLTPQSSLRIPVATIHRLRRGQPRPFSHHNFLWAQSLLSAAPKDPCCSQTRASAEKLPDRRITSPAPRKDPGALPIFA